MNEETEIKCSPYTTYATDDLNYIPCQCPVCGGFLRWKDEVPICKKCGTELLAIPDPEIDGEGKICPISLPKRKGGV